MRPSRLLPALALLPVLGTPPVSAQEPEPDPAASRAQRFVAVTGTNLNERRFTLPADFEADYNLVFLAFERWQQKLVDSWLPFATEFEQRYANLRFYELPTMAQFPEAFQRFVDNGMRSGIRDLNTRARTICLYIDRTALFAGLDIENTSKIEVRLVARDGTVHFASRGGYDEKAAAELSQRLSTLARPRPKAEHDLLAGLRAAGKYGTLLRAIEAAGLAATLAEPGPWTLLAPTDEAFAALGEETLAELLQPEQRERLRALLLAHVARGYFDLRALEGRSSLTSAAASTHEVVATQGARPALSGRRTLVEVPCTNGVIVVVDGVLPAPPRGPRGRR